MKSKLLLLFLTVTTLTFGQDASHNWTVQLYAEVNDDPLSITLKWLPNAAVGETYFIWKKEKETIGWGTSIGSVSAGDELEFTDTDIAFGRSYEYMVQLRSAGTVLAWSYVNSGVGVPLDPNKGDMLLLVDERHASELASEIAVLEQDMYRDGWMVSTAIIDSTSTPEEVKDQIKDYYQSLPRLVGLYLLGNIAVPYSGELYPDFFINHWGAWPADVYYGDMFGEWTDTDVNNTIALDSRNHNIPGDGKFDQSSVPSSINLQVSRVDFHDLDAFTETEEDLLSGYLNKAHTFKMAEYRPVERGMFDQGNLTFSSEGFAQNAIRNFTAFFGPDSVSEADYWTTLNGNDYLWSYGSGSGTYSLANDLNGLSALTSDHIADGFNESTFTMLYGSYFGDWDTPNNLMRSVIANGRTLSCSWAGRPNWHYHHMALGENIGYSARTSQDKYSDYSSLSIGTLVTWEGVHVAQLGDPSLRMYYLTPPGEVTVETEAENAVLNWEASTEVDLDGYNVYRRPTDGLWSKVNPEILTETNFIDTTVPDAGDYIYMVKTTKLKTNSSGSFYNESLGSEAEAVSFFVGLNELDFDFKLFPNPSNGFVTVSSNENIDLIRVLSADGRVVYQSNPNSGLTKLDLEEFGAGVYFVELESGNVKRTERLVLQ